MISVLKLGGNANVDQRRVLRNLATRILNGEQWLLVHGASGATNALAHELGLPVHTITSPGGHVSRYTDKQMIQVYRMAVARVNRQMRDMLTNEGVQVTQFAAPSVIRARRKTAIRAIQRGRQVVIRDDYSGTITDVTTIDLLAALKAKLTPIIAPIAMGANGESLNVDGDLVAAQIARAMSAHTLMILSDVPGLLRDVEDHNTLISQLSYQELSRVEDIALGRMKKKVVAVQQAQVPRVILADSRPNCPLDDALLGGGTHIISEATYV